MNDKSMLRWVAALDLPKTLHGITVPPTKHSTVEMEPKVSWYMEDGGLSISLVSKERGEPCLTATVALDRAPRESHVYLKEWGENEGVPEALVEAGIVTLTGGFQLVGYATALEAKLTARFHGMLKGAGS